MTTADKNKAKSAPPAEPSKPGRKRSKISFPVKARIEVTIMANGWVLVDGKPVDNRAQIGAVVQDMADEILGA